MWLPRRNFHLRQSFFRIVCIWAFLQVNRFLQLLPYQVVRMSLVVTRIEPGSFRGLAIRVGCRKWATFVAPPGQAS